MFINFTTKTKTAVLSDSGSPATMEKRQEGHSAPRTERVRRCCWPQRPLRLEVKSPNNEADPAGGQPTLLETNDRTSREEHLRQLHLPKRSTPSNRRLPCTNVVANLLTQWHSTILFQQLARNHQLTGPNWVPNTSPRLCATTGYGCTTATIEVKAAAVFPVRYWCSCGDGDGCGCDLGCDGSGSACSWGCGCGSYAVAATIATTAAVAVTYASWWLKTAQMFVFLFAGPIHASRPLAPDWSIVVSSVAEQRAR